MTAQHREGRQHHGKAGQPQGRTQPGHDKADGRFPVAERNAVDHEVTFEDEIAILVVHGVLHLLGWDHMIDEEAERMEAREQEILNRYYRLRIVK